MMDRPPCPVLTRSNALPAGQFICTECWSVVPQYVRVAVSSTARDATLRPTARNRARAKAAERSAISAATGLRT